MIASCPFIPMMVLLAWFWDHGNVKKVKLKVTFFFQSNLTDWFGTSASLLKIITVVTNLGKYMVWCFPSLDFCFSFSDAIHFAKGQLLLLLEQLHSKLSRRILVKILNPCAFIVCLHRGKDGHLTVCAKRLTVGSSLPQTMGESPWQCRPSDFDLWQIACRKCASPFLDSTSDSFWFFQLIV